MAVYRGPVRRWLRGRSRHSQFARLLGKPGFDPDDVRAEVAGRVEHGPAGADPECRGDGAVALLPGRQLGWVAPVAAGRPPGPDSMIALPDRLDGHVEAAWVTAWSLEAGELGIHYVIPPQDALRGRRVLRVTGDPAALADFVARAAPVLSGRRRD
jgi:hypothetical protein